MTVNVNEYCIGCGLCTTICPEVFSMGDNGAAKSNGDFPDELENSVREAADSCPVDAIELG